MSALTLHRLDNEKICIVGKHPYIPIPLYTYEKSDISELKGNNSTSLSFISQNKINDDLFVAEITPYTYDSKVIFAWTPSLSQIQKNKVREKMYLATKMYQSFIPSFLSKKGFDSWYFTTNLDEASRFTEIEKVKDNYYFTLKGEDNKLKKYLIIE